MNRPQFLIGASLLATAALVLVAAPPKPGAETEKPSADLQEGSYRAATFTVW